MTEISSPQPAPAPEHELLTTFTEWARQVAAREDVPRGIRSAAAGLHDDGKRMLAKLYTRPTQSPAEGDDLRAAAAHALETLEVYVQTYNDYWERGMDILEPKGEDAITRLSAALANPQPKGTPKPLTWYDGPPPFPQDQEWFIAETIYGDRVALIALEEGRRKSMDWEFKTADGTYLKRASVKRWMQFPDCQYIPPAVQAPEGGNTNA